MARYLVRVTVELEIEADNAWIAQSSAEASIAQRDLRFAEDCRLVQISSVLPKRALTRKKAGE